MDGIKLIKLFEIKTKVKEAIINILFIENIFLGITMLLYVAQR
jgi:hypothetical protein